MIAPDTLRPEDISTPMTDRYELYGLTIQSEVPLAVGAPACAFSGQPDVVIRRLPGPPPPPPGRVLVSVPCPTHGVDMTEHRSADGIWIWFHAFGSFHIYPGGGQVDVYPAEHVDESSLGMAIAGPILLFVRHQRGLPSLHASAVVTNHGAVGFLGEHGQGKSTIAAAFLHRGATLLTDDAIALECRPDGVFALPGPAFMKVWDATVHGTLSLSEDLPRVMRDIDKRLMAVEGRYPLAQEPARIRALYLLERYDPAAAGRSDISIRRLNHRDAIFTLIRHTSVRPYLLPADDRQTLPAFGRLLAQTPVQVLSYPHGFEHQEVVHSCILTDLETL